jgi:hypothetical protein
MTLPASLLHHAEQHPCFTGCYSSEPNVSVCLDPNHPPASVVSVSCQDCFARVGAPVALLPSGSNSHTLAAALTQHVRARRGYAVSVGGYNARGPGFWLGVVYYGRGGLFLLDGERSRRLGTDLDLLQMAFKHGVLTPPDPRMLDPKQFAVQSVFVNFAAPLANVATKQALLASPQCRLQPQPGWQKVTLAEFLPLAPAPTASNGPAATPTAARPVPRKTLKVGEVCPVCGAVVRERQLLKSTFVGCLC